MADPDFLLAKILQAKFDKEAESVRKKNSESGPAKRPTLLVSDSSYKGSPPKKLKSSSLVDPEWEIIDPTPDIHTLFITFNKRFFWGALESVEVRWSPRMYSCAGLCSYEGRRGMCSVRLSEPLLKLRPRSDLVETLLHEMIHAYLFVTHNNRDRTGHGPEFHKHMYRINNEAGTNITVYHSFHDEVKLYKKHWWRCDGPCQFRPPFMGLVKRTMNRAPGPYDSWWTTHQATCGGTFIKVREPTNTKLKQVQPNVSGNLTKGGTGKDIRNFFNTPGNSQGSSSLPKSSVPSSNSNFKKPSSQSSVVSKPNGFPTNRPNGSALTGFKGQNVFGIGSSNVNGVSHGVKKPVPGSSNSVQGVNRVVGFGDLNSQSTNSNSNPTRNLFGGSGQKLGGGNGTGSQLGKPNSNPTRNNFGGSGQKLGGNSTGLSSQSAKPTSFGGSGQKLGGTGTGNPWKANTNRIGGALMNRGGGTLVITAKGTAKDSKMTQSDKTTEDTKSFVPFNGQGQKLGCASVGTLNSSSSVLRLSGANSKTNSAGKNLTGRDRINSAPEFSNRNNPSGSSCVKDSKPSTSRSGSSASLYSGSPVKTELEASFNNSAVTISDEEFADVADFVDYDKDVDDNGEDDVHCPVCNMSLKRDDMSMHLENCDALKATMDNINNSSRPDYDDDDDDVVEVSEENSPASQLIKENDESGNAPIFPCPCCSKYFTESQINKHLDECLSLLALQEFGNAF
ncbi:DNA-dependent metalloprotease SPRTN isoform X2 [Nilaparvata lugens]|uniref:DNA-dependent metalloprotease SPRTN isoform X2 n=1 Tax=Nilaparvata lugens TaxID=108931 RepID=UPI00193E8996|nr:DNA-dependent metalloprotease SPRTN isoform X2 [Nilaparvata lugens]XP_039283720.1 DNA-dependent metalloprotease SPRTN isoform X2 [Nilaparvata lugens]XP_039283721.1 DNA-dependent metalloprotease SPRTN isoform X2 [Nilaparvata lugens]